VEDPSHAVYLGLLGGDVAFPAADPERRALMTAGGLDLQQPLLTVLLERLDVVAGAIPIEV
jgi:hypothetical protein